MMLAFNRMTSLRLKGLVFILLLAACAPAAQAEEESSTTPLIIENIPDSGPSEPVESSSAATTTTQIVTGVSPSGNSTPDASPASGSTPVIALDTTTESGSSAAISYSGVVAKIETFLTESPSVPQGVKTFLQGHPNEILWVKEHPLHINAFALVFAILCRMCCGGEPAPKRPKTKAPRPLKAAPPAARYEPPVPAARQAPAPSSKPSKTADEPAKNPFQRVLEETLKSPATPARDTFIVQSFLRWAAAEPKPAYQWAIGLEDAAFGRKLLTDALLAEEEKDAAAAFDLALDTLPPALQDPVIDAVIRQWTRKKPEAAAEKIAALPSSAPVLQTAIAALVETWASKDIEAAHQWLLGLPINLFRDLALAVFIQQLMQQSPESAAAWVESIANDQVRQQVAGLVAQKWQSVDAEAANAWLEKSHA